MKTFRFAKYIVLAGAVGVFSSCDSFLDVNTNPNAVIVAPAGNVLVAAQTQLGFTAGSDLHRFTSLIVQQFAGQGGSAQQPVQYDRGVITGSDVNNAFRFSIYATGLADMQQLINSTQESSPVYAGIAKLMQAYLYGITTDCFGDIPFSEALKFVANGAPKYDESSEVYKGILALIDAGIADLKKPSSLKPGAEDLIYGGDLAKWEKFGNTLKMRLYIHYYPKFPDQAAKGIGDLLTAKAPVMTSVADNFQLGFEAVVGKTNSIDQFERSRPNQFFPSATLVGIMNTKADPRRPSFFTEFGGAGQYTGAANGAGATVSTDFSRMNTYLRGPRTGTGLQDYAGSAPIRMMTYAEYQFILAEYYGRTGSLANARTALEAGILASMTMAGISVAEPTATTPGGAGYLYAKSRPALTTANYLQQIIEEKYVANFGVVAEPWTDYRRTGFPQLALPASAQTTAILRILPYSDADRAANPANTPARTSLIVPSVFWDPGK